MQGSAGASWPKNKNKAKHERNTPHLTTSLLRTVMVHDVHATVAHALLRNHAANHASKYAHGSQYGSLAN
eukprot:4129999-Alexandrium_andersonii.AAC.1